MILRICQNGILLLFLYYYRRMMAGHFFDSFWQRMSAEEVLGHRFGFVSFLSRVLSQGATDIQEGVLVVLSRIHPIGRYRQRKRLLQYGDGVQAELVMVVVQASLADGMKDFHSYRDVGV